ncbi:MAG TPA: GFA family protein [Burkholderiales bacterium]|nr:GFA family protein [Burkholderiales bacterium]
MIYNGSCHCGQIAFEAEGELQKVIECNCSICSKRGTLHWPVSSENFRLLNSCSPATYTFNKHRVRHRFCPGCGCALYAERTEPSGKQLILVNARSLEGVDLSKVEIGHFDGRSL